MPGGGERGGLRLAIPDDRSDDEVRVVSKAAPQACERT